MAPFTFSNPNSDGSSGRNGLIEDQVGLPDPGTQRADRLRVSGASSDVQRDIAGRERFSRRSKVADEISFTGTCVAQIAGGPKLGAAHFGRVGGGWRG